MIDWLIQAWKKYRRYMDTRNCVSKGHPWYPEDGPLPKHCPKCIAEDLPGILNHLSKEERRALVKLAAEGEEDGGDPNVDPMAD
jgi:hypothetical protein